MANTKITDMTAITAFADTMQVPIVDDTLAENSQNQKFTITQLKSLFVYKNYSGENLTIGNGSTSTLFDMAADTNVFLVSIVTTTGTNRLIGLATKDNNGNRWDALADVGSGTGINQSYSGDNFQITNGLGSQLDFNWTAIQIGGV